MTFKDDCISGDLEKVKKWIRQQKPGRTLNLNKGTSGELFRRLCEYDRIEIIEYLTGLKENPLLPTQTGIYAAIRAKKPRMVKYLLDKFPLTYLECELYFSLTCEFGDVETLEIILKYFTIDVKGEGANNDPFRISCESGNVEVVKHLLSLGCNQYIDVHSPKHYKYSDMSEALLSTIRNYFLNFDTLETLKLLLSLRGDRRLRLDERFLNKIIDKYIPVCREKVMKVLTLVLDNKDERFSREFYNKIFKLDELRTSVGIHILRIARIRLKESRYDHCVRMNKSIVIKHLKCLPPGEPLTSYPGGVDYHRLINKYKV